jgi:hypothetical protein
MMDGGSQELNEKELDRKEEVVVGLPAVEEESPACHHNVSRLGRGGGYPRLQTTSGEEALPLMGSPDLGLRLQAVREDARVGEHASRPPGRPSVSGTRASRPPGRPSVSGTRASRPSGRPFASGSCTSRPPERL